MSLFGTVIGCYNYPALAELQIKILRDQTPLLLVSDRHRGRHKREAYHTVAQNYNVKYLENERRVGHYLGDLLVIYHGLRWAYESNYQYLVKLSQRFIITKPLAPEIEAFHKLKSPTLLATHCPMGLRTEAMIFHVKSWIMYQDFFAMPPPGTVEEYVAWIAEDDLIAPWGLVAPDRKIAVPGVIWRAANTIQDYRAVAAQYGIKLDDDLSTLGWWEQANYQKYPKN